MRRSRKEKEGEFAFLCGLLHDLGKVVLFKTYPSHYGSIFAVMKSEEDPAIYSYEAANYGADHAGIGEMLAKQWGLPPELASVIRKHHDPLAVGVPMVSAVMLADMMAKELRIGYDGDDGLYEGLSKLLPKLDITQSEFEHLTAFANRERENIERFFKISG
jgi:HD-like signal output (HDOD) protein